jgi:hypothetical protein
MHLLVLVLTTDWNEGKLADVTNCKDLIPRDLAEAGQTTNRTNVYTLPEGGSTYLAATDGAERMHATAIRMPALQQQPAADHDEP